MFKPCSLFYTDGYKVGHAAMLAPGTKRLYGTWIPRHLKYAPEGITEIVSFGQQLTWKWINDEFTEHFFKQPIEIAESFGKDMSAYLMMDYDSSHFGELHKLGYLPIKVKALPEGISTKPNIPHMTFINTVDGFAWLTLYLETIVSSLAWKPSTSATIAREYKRNAVEWVTKTDPDNLWLTDYMCHDFSARGLSPWDMISSGLGHASSHRGSDTLMTIPASRYFYNEVDVCINSVNASEHSVSTTKIFTVGEKQMVKDWMKIFPKGILSAVMDTMDITKVVRPDHKGYLMEIKKLIQERDGKLVIRPDSSPSPLTPIEIICGWDGELTDRMKEADYPEFYKKGLIQCLWEIFGGSVNKKGFKVLDPHIGAIYGDAITLDRQVGIYEKLAENGFASTNIILGVGSYTYQFNTRDTFGWAAKGGWFCTEDKEYEIFKDPMTDDGEKKSPKGLLQVKDGVLKEMCTKEEENEGDLQVIFEDGKFYNETSLTEIRKRLYK